MGDEYVKDNLVDGQPQPPEKDNADQQGDDSAKKARHAQQQEGARAEVKKARDLAKKSAYKAAEANAQNLLDLHAEDPKLANEVSQMFGYGDFDEAKAAIDGASKKTEEKQGLSESEFDTLYQKRRATERHDEAIDYGKGIIVEGVKDEVLQEQALAYFEELIEGKKFSGKEALKKAKKFAETATLYVGKDKLKASAAEDVLLKLGGSGVGTPKKQPKKGDEPYTVVRDGKLVILDPKKS